MLPMTRYAQSGEVSIAYQSFGEGDIDIVITPGFISNLEFYWDDPRATRWLTAIGRFARVTIFDKRGTGLSDRVKEPPSMETRATDRTVATILFSDIVNSTRRAEALGDRKWRGLLDAHDKMVRKQLARFKGREIKSLGDGFMSIFDSPSRAIRAAQAMRDEANRIGIELRLGMHAGEVEITDKDVRGIAVHIAARVSALAPTDGILVSSTVKELVAGSGTSFADFGVHELKGVPDAGRLLRVI